jgi:hypothetical protein
MPVITYVAADRGRLASGHSASTQYQIECDFQSYPERQVPQGARDVTLDGTPEGWLDHVKWERTVTTDIILSAQWDDFDEFYSSVCNNEQFQIDFTGTLASPGTDIDMYLTGNPTWSHVGGVGRIYTFTAKTV